MKTQTAMVSKLGIARSEQESVRLDNAAVGASRLYSYCVLSGLVTIFPLTVAAIRYLLGQSPTLASGVAAFGCLFTLILYIAYRWMRRPIDRYQTRKEALKEEFRRVRLSSCERLDGLFQNSPAAIADRKLSERIQNLTDFRDQENARWDQASWWNQLAHRPDFSDVERTIAELKKAKQRLDAAGEVRRARDLFHDFEDKCLRRIDAAERLALEALSQSHPEHSNEKAIAKSALLLSAMSVPISAWDDITRAGDIFDSLRAVNGNYMGMSDFDIWVNTLIMPGESLAGLASLTKGAYFERLVEDGFGGERFENFNNPETDIVIDGVAYQIKATDSPTYLATVPDGTPVIATTEVAGVTGAIDGGYSNAELERSVELALGGTVVDVNDTAADALLIGVGGIGILATVKGINHGASVYRDGSDGFEAVLEGAGVAITATAKSLVDTAELGYKAATSRPARAIGRASMKVVGSVGRRLFGG